MKRSWVGIVALTTLMLGVTSTPTSASNWGLDKDVASEKRESAAELKLKYARELRVFENFFDSLYAPADWKQQYSGWTVTGAVQKAQEELAAMDTVTLSDFHRIVKHFFNSTKDYHVGVSFIKSEFASLPFSVKGVQGRYFLAEVNRDRLPYASFPFDQGDEIIEFDGQPIAAVIDHLRREEFGDNVFETDQALAEIYLTRRSAARAVKVPQGPITVGIVQAGSDRIQRRQLVWTYTPEVVRPGPSEAVLAKPGCEIEGQNEFGKRLFARQPAVPNLLKEKADGPFSLGGFDSYVPELGEIIWSGSPVGHFKAYIYRNEEGRQIGYVRIPHYSCNAPQVNEFAHIMKKMAQNTEALVIDEVNNPGGSVFYLYALASMLTDSPLKTPKHRIAITQDDVVGALEAIPYFEWVGDEEDAQRLLGAHLGGFPVSYQLAQSMLGYFRGIVSSWNAGKTLTDPMYLYVDDINPCSYVNYTAPIVVLTNELCFSGGDFFPAILQDNARATIVGTRTAGAGGFVLGMEYPNRFAIGSFSLTGSLAERVSNNPIENLGVTPDHHLELTVNDIQGNFGDYRDSVNSIVNSLLEGDEHVAFADEEAAEEDFDEEEWI